MVTQHFMLFNIGGLELGLIVLVFIMLFGTDKIPEIARGIGKGMKSIRNATDEIKREINETANSSEAFKELNDIKKGADEARKTVDNISGTFKRNTKL